MRAQHQILQNLNHQEALEEWTKWKALNGGKSKFMDDKYEPKIMYKLIPKLKEYGIDVSQYPVKDAPGYQTYCGYTEDNERIDFIFINKFEDTKNYRNGKYDMTVIIHFKGDEQIAGVINLKNKNYVDEAFELITMTMENMGIIGNKPETSEEPEEDNSELDDLANFKNSLSEQEILDIEVE